MTGNSLVGIDKWILKCSIDGIFHHFEMKIEGILCGKIARTAQWVLRRMHQTSNWMSSLAGSVPKTEEDHQNL